MWFVEAAEAARQWGVFFCSLWTLQNSCERACPRAASGASQKHVRMGRSLTQAMEEHFLKLLDKDGIMRPRAASGRLWTEREHHWKVSGAWQILWSTRPGGQLGHSPKLTHLGEWHKVAFLSGSSRARAKVKALDLYFRPILSIAAECCCSGWPRWETDKELFVCVCVCLREERES